MHIRAISNLKNVCCAVACVAVGLLAGCNDADSGTLPSTDPLTMQQEATSGGLIVDADSPFLDSDAVGVFNPETGLFESETPVPPPKQPFPNVPDDGSYTPQPVFPGAEGFGTYTPAGRLGGVCTVTNLNDGGDGSLRYCVKAKGSKTIQFSVSGRIELRSPLVLEEPFISILGQSAPEPGIMLTLHPSVDGAVVAVKTHDVLIQHMRIRAGASDSPSCCRDAVVIGSEKAGQVYNVVLDHNSLSWATDEIIDIWFDSRDITLSRNIFSEGLHRSTNIDGPAGRGLLIGANAHSISIHHNLFAHNYERNPSVSSTGVTDIVNNVIYHWVSRGAQFSTKYGNNYVNLVKNVFIAHTDGKPQPSAINWYDVSLDGDQGHELKVYFEGNFGYWRGKESDPEWSLAGVGWRKSYQPNMGLHTDVRHDAPPVTEFSVDQLEEVLMNDVGATLPIRDSVDARVIDEMRWRSGYMPDCVQDCELNARGWPSLGQ